MTTKFGEHSLDKYISTTGTVGAKYVCQEMTGLRFEAASIKEARRAVAGLRDPRLSKDIGRAYASIAKPVPGIQARPVAAPAAKAHVPKGGGKKPTPVKNPAAWPFPTTTKLPLPKAPAGHLEQVTINGVLYELDTGLNIEFLSSKHIRITIL